MDKLLARGELFQPADTFIDRIGLFLVADNRLKDLIIRMCDLARRKMKDRRHQRAMQSWIEEAARTLDVLQMMSVDWINRHVHRSSVRSRRVRQSAESKARYRDYRLKDNPDLERRVYDVATGRSAARDDDRFDPLGDDPMVIHIDPPESVQQESSDHSRAVSPVARPPASHSPQRPGPAHQVSAKGMGSSSLSVAQLLSTRM